MYPHLSLVAGLGGQSLAVLVGTDGEREKAKLLLCLQQQVEALSQSAVHLEARRDDVAQKNVELEQQIAEKRTRCSGKDNEVKALSSKLVVAEDELIYAKMRLELLKEEGAKRSAVYEAEWQRHEDSLREGRVDLKQRKLEKKRDDTENILLLRLLNAEAEKWKHQTIELQSAVEVQVREEAKSDILQALVNAQLETQREENNALRKEADTLKRELRATEKLHHEVRTRHAHLTQLLEQHEDSDDKAQKEHYFKISRRQTHEARQETSVEVLEGELSDLSAEIDVYKKRTSLKSRTVHDEQARLEAERDKLRCINAELRRVFQTIQEVEAVRGSERDDEIMKLATQRETVVMKRDLMELKRFDESVANSNSIELLVSQRAALSERAKTFDGRAIIEGAAIRDRIEAAKAMAVAIRAEDNGSDFKSLKTVIASNECLRNQIVALRKRAAERNHAHIEERIEMAADLAKNKALKVSLEDEATMSGMVQKKALSDLQEERDRVLCTEEGTEEVHRIVANLRERCAMVGREQETLTQHAQALEKEGTRGQKFFEDKCLAYQAEAKVHRNEIVRLQGTVTRLEARVAETQQYCMKSEENEILEKEIKNYKKEQRYMQNVISTMKVEKGLLDGYKAKVLTEQNESQLQKLRALESLKARHVPLLKELLATARKHDVKSDAIKNAERAALELGISCYHTPSPPKNIW